jgi:DNA-binding IclR family transcriptional regulator
MGGSTPTSPASIALPVQARVFEAVASTGLLAGPIHDLARQFGVTPSTFMECLGVLVDVGWVAVVTDSGSLVSVRLEP